MLHRRPCLACRGAGEGLSNLPVGRPNLEESAPWLLCRLLHCLHCLLVRPTCKRAAAYFRVVLALLPSWRPAAPRPAVNLIMVKLATSAVAELDLGSDKGPATANWKATVTSAFRATLAASLRSGTFNPRSHLDAGSGGSGVNGTHHATSRGSLDGRSMRSSLDGGATRSSGGTAPTRLGPGGAAAAAAAGAAAEWPPLLGQRPPARCARAERFQQWLRLLLFQLMGALAAVSGSAPGSAAAAAGAAPEGPWVSALSSLLHLGSYEGRIVRAFVEDLPLGVVAALLEQSRRHCWSEHLHAWLVSLAANLLYAHSDQEEGGLQRSVKAVSLRSDGTGSATGRAFGGWGPPAAWVGGTERMARQCGGKQRPAEDASDRQAIPAWVVHTPRLHACPQPHHKLLPLLLSARRQHASSTLLSLQRPLLVVWIAARL